MPHPGDNIHIPLKTDEALRLALKVKPTKDMPRPGANPTKPKMNGLRNAERNKANRAEPFETDRLVDR